MIVGKVSLVGAASQGLVRCPSTALHGVGAEIDRIIALISLSFVLSPRNEEKVYVYLSSPFPQLWCSKSKLPWIFYKPCLVYSIDNEVLFY